MNDTINESVRLHLRDRLVELIEADWYKTPEPDDLGQVASVSSDELKRRYETHMNTAIRLLDAGAAIDNKECRDENPLHLACAHQKNGIVKLLIERGATLNIRDTAGCLPTHIAAENDNVEALKILIDKDADFTSRTSLDDSPFDYSILSSSKACFELLLEDEKSRRELSQEDYDNGLIHACEKHNSSIIKSLIDRRANVKYSNDSGSTALFMAVRYGLGETIDLLLDVGSDIEHRNNLNQTPLMYASLFGGPAKAEHLIMAGALIDAERSTKVVNEDDPHHRITALDHAATHNQHTFGGSSTIALLSHGARITPCALKANRDVRNWQRIAQTSYNEALTSLTLNPALITAQNLIYAANLGKLPELLNPSAWRGHEAELQTLLGSLPPHSQKHIMQLCPKIVPLLTAPSSVISDWQVMPLVLSEEWMR